MTLKENVRGHECVKGNRLSGETKGEPSELVQIDRQETMSNRKQILNLRLMN